MKTKYLILFLIIATIAIFIIISFISHDSSVKSVALSYYSDPKMDITVSH